MAEPAGWISYGPNKQRLTGVGDTYGELDHGNTYLRGLYTNFRLGHTEYATHKPGLNSQAFLLGETGTYTGDGAATQLITLTLTIAPVYVEIYPESATFPGLAGPQALPLGANKVIGTIADQSFCESTVNPGEFVVRTGPYNVNLEVYHFVVWGTDES